MSILDFIIAAKNGNIKELNSLWMEANAIERIEMIEAHQYEAFKNAHPRCFSSLAKMVLPYYKHNPCHFEQAAEAIIENLVKNQYKLKRVNGLGMSQSSVKVETKENKKHLVSKTLSNEEKEKIRLLNRSLLNYASRGNLEGIRSMIAQGANVEYSWDNQDTPLHKACAAGHTKAALLLIRKCGAKINVRNFDNETPLILASKAGDIRVVRELIRRKANLNVQVEHSKSALDWAARHGQLKVIDKLIKTPGIERINHALWYAAREGQLAAVTMLLKVISLKEMTAFFYIQETVLMVAIRGSHLAVVETLITLPGVDVYVKGQWGSAALMYAIETNAKDAVALLLSHHAKLELSGQKGNEFIIDIAKNGSRKFCLLLSCLSTEERRSVIKTVLFADASRHAQLYTTQNWLGRQVNDKYDIKPGSELAAILFPLEEDRAMKSVAMKEVESMIEAIAQPPKNEENKESVKKPSWVDIVKRQATACTSTICTSRS
jgi:ankyrin repeat protein